MKQFKCCHCLAEKPVTDFYKDKHKASGFKPRCKPCDSLSLDKENRKKYEKKYWESRLKKRRGIVLKSYRANKEHHKKIRREYLQSPSGSAKHREHLAIRRSRMKSAFVERVDYRHFYDSSSKECFYCHVNLSFASCEFDHFIPLAKGGKHQRSNIRLSCSFCNRSKGAKMPMGVSYQVV